MIRDKILIFFPYECNINMGGPAGFIAHNLVDKPRDFFVLLQDFPMPNPSFITKAMFFVRSRLEKLKSSKDIYVKEYLCSSYFNNCNAKSYKYIFFHDCETMYACRNLISDEQFVILQSHSPELPSEEYNNTIKSSKLKNKIRLEYIKKAEKFSFERANVIILPNEYCIDLYRNILPEKLSVDFILSGAKCGYNNQEIDDSGVDNNKINILYIGRRNSIKGFDIVLNAFRNAYKTNKNINLIIVGKGDKIDESGIVDIGFSNSPISWYERVDYVINANRQSYFDLSVIEALSTGVPIIMANNYGHKWFNGKSELITMFDGSVDNLSKILISDTLTKRDINNRSNIELYENFLTDKLYYERFKEFFNQLRNNEL